MASAPLRYRLLGPLDVVRPAAVNGAAAQAVRRSHRARVPQATRRPRGAAAAARSGRLDRSPDRCRLGRGPPPSALASLQAYISNLRRALRDDAARPRRSCAARPATCSRCRRTRLDVARSARPQTPPQGRRRDAGARARARGPGLPPGAASCSRPADEHWVPAEARRRGAARRMPRERGHGAAGRGRVSPALVAAGSARRAPERAALLAARARAAPGRARPEALEAYRATPSGSTTSSARPGPRAARPAERDPAPRPRAGRLAARAARSGAPGRRAPTPPVAGRAAEPGRRPARPVRRAGRPRRESRGHRPAAGRPAHGPRALAGAHRAAGIGKSRLAEECAERRRRAAARGVVGGLPGRTTSPAWWPMRQIVRALGADPDTVLTPPGRRRCRRGAVRGLRTGAAAAGPAATPGRPLRRASTTSTGPTRLRCVASPTSPARCGRRRSPSSSPSATVRPATPVAPLLAAVARGEGPAAGGAARWPPTTWRDLASRVAGEPIERAEARRLAERTGGNPFFVCEYARLPTRGARRRRIPSRSGRSSGGGWPGSIRRRCKCCARPR